MDHVLQTDDRSLEEVLQGFSGVSGSSIVCSSEVDVIEVHSKSDFIDSYVPLSSSALCLMVIAAFFYKKFLDLVKTIINSFFKEAVSRYDRK